MISQNLLIFFEFVAFVAIMTGFFFEDYRKYAILSAFLGLNGLAFAALSYSFDFISILYTGVAFIVTVIELDYLAKKYNSVGIGIPNVFENDLVYKYQRYAILVGILISFLLFMQVFSVLGNSLIGLWLNRCFAFIFAELVFYLFDLMFNTDKILLER